MGREFKIRGILLCVTVIVAILFLGGCLFMPHSYTYGKVIKEDKVKMIQPGKTTKEEIIQWFGIPTIIQKSGEKESQEKKEVAEVGIMGPFGGVVSQPSFDLFSSKHKITDDHRIYVYTFTKSKGASFNFLFFGSMDTHSFTDKLLVLVNEKTGIAEDYIFRKEE